MANVLVLAAALSLSAGGGAKRIYVRSAPFPPPPAPGTTAGKPGAAPLEVTTLWALPGPFRKQFRVTQTPVLFLLDRSGKVTKRWTGYSPSLADSLAGGGTRRTA